MEVSVPILVAIAGLLMLLVGAVNDDRRARRTRKQFVKLELSLLHSINDDRCIGCEACVDVCPTNVLELVDHKVRVARFTDCVQCEQCAHSCPTTALVMYREGQAPQMLTVPRLDDTFQTGVPGQYLIGEVAGKPLVKNAANLGRAVIEHIARSAPRSVRPELLDVVIVGSGPGGLSAGLTCIKQQLSCVVLEKEHVLASTVARYPKGKHFMAEPSHVQNLSYLPVFDGTKEQLVAAWRKVADGVKLPVRLGEAVETVVRGDDGVFTIKTTVATYRARTVVLATGLRGKPRLLAVPGANLEKVQSRLDDPAVFADQDVLVVGGGDSAVEAAMSLVDAGARVTLSYRGDGFKRCKSANQKRLAEYAGAKRIGVLLESNVKEFTVGEVRIELAGGRVQTVPNQASFVLIGADTPVAWLETNNVEFIEREHLYALGSTEDSVRSAAADAKECPRSAEEALAVLLGVRPSRGRLRSVVEGLVPEPKPGRRGARTGVEGVVSAPKPRGRLRTVVEGLVSDVTGVFRTVGSEKRSRTEFPIEQTAHHGRAITLTPSDDTRPASRIELGDADDDEQTMIDPPLFARPSGRRLAHGSSVPPPIPAKRPLPLPSPPADARRATLGGVSRPPTPRNAQKRIG